MTELSPTERRSLRAQAHHLDPVVMIGDAGLTEAVSREIDRALNFHELIKVRMLGDDREARVAAAEQIVTDLGAALVQHIGKLLILYRPMPEELKPAPAKPKKPKGPHKSKKGVGSKIEARRKK